MKKTLLLLLYISLFVASCSKTKEGGLQYRRIYILEGENLIDAQDKTIYLKLEGETTTIDYVGPAFFTVTWDRSVDGITVIPVSEPKSLVIDTGSEFFSGIVQTISISAEPASKKRKAVCTINSNFLNGYAAKLTIIQSY